MTTHPWTPKTITILAPVEPDAARLAEAARRVMPTAEVTTRTSPQRGFEFDGGAKTPLSTWRPQVDLIRAILQAGGGW